MTTNLNEWERDFIEKAAALEHARWARWQAYLHDKTLARDGMIYFSEQDFLRWQRQIKTPYEELSEQEKESDRQEVLEYLPLVSQLLQEAREDERQKVIESLFEIERDKWKDAKHCTCLGYAIVEIAGGEDSPAGQEMEKRLLALTPSTEEGKCCQNCAPKGLCVTDRKDGLVCECHKTTEDGKGDHLTK